MSHPHVAAPKLWSGLALGLCLGGCYGAELPGRDAREVGGRSGAGSSEPRDAGASAGRGNAEGGAGGTGVAEAPPVQPDPTDAGGSPVSQPERVYCDAVSRVFQVSCGNGSCHSNARVTIGDFAVGPDEAAAYVNRVSVRNAACGLIINPRNPEDSLILTKVTGDFPSEQGCGAQMPVGAFGDVTDEQIECLADWVEQFRL